MGLLAMLLPLPGGTQRLQIHKQIYKIAESLRIDSKKVKRGAKKGAKIALLMSSFISMTSNITPINP